MDSRITARRVRGRALMHPQNQISDVNIVPSESGFCLILSQHYADIHNIEILAKG